MRISVIGLGYVGCVASACLAEGGHHLVCVDIDPLKIQAINNGTSPIIEPGLAALIQKHVKNNTLRATSDFADAIQDTDITLICVGTPGNDDGSLNLDHVLSAVGSIAGIIKEKESFHSIVMRSTVLPGSSEQLILPTLEIMSGKTVGQDFGYANNPEFLREGTAIFDYFNPPKVVIGQMDEVTTTRLCEIYKEMTCPVITTSLKVSESVKYADNVWHAMKVGFANELGNILKEHGVDSHEVMDIFLQDTKLNISPAYLKPGFSFGGSCLPKDLKALSNSANKKGLATPLFDSLLQANEDQIERARSMVRSTGAKNIGFLGLTFKPDSGDLRHSPLISLASLLIKDGLSVWVYEPSLDKETYDYFLKHSKQTVMTSDLLETDPDIILRNCDALVIGHRNSGFKDILRSISPDTHIIDLVRMNDTAPTNHKNYAGICW